LTKLEQLRRKQQKLAKQVYKLEEIAEQKRNANLQCRYFKYKNSYGNGDIPWWMYLHVVDTKPAVIVFEFQRTSRDEFSIKRRGWHNIAGYIEISQTEYTAAWAVFCRDLNAFAAATEGVNNGKGR